MPLTLQVISVKCLGQLLEIMPLDLHHLNTWMYRYLKPFVANFDILPAMKHKIGVFDEHHLPILKEVYNALYPSLVVPSTCQELTRKWIM